MSVWRWCLHNPLRNYFAPSLELMLGWGACNICMLLTWFVFAMSTLLKALSLRSYGAGFLSSAYITHNISRRTNCEPLSSTARAASTTSLATNPLMNKKSTPLFAEIRPEHILPAMNHDLASLKTGFAGKFLHSETHFTHHALTENAHLY